MKKTINHKTYNTEKATKIFKYATDNLYRTDFGYFEFKLYVDDENKYFIAGHGKCLSIFGKMRNDTYVPGSGIIPIRKTNAILLLLYLEAPEKVIESFFPNHGLSLKNFEHWSFLDILYRDENWKI